MKIGKWKASHVSLFCERWSGSSSHHTGMFIWAEPSCWGTAVARIKMTWALKVISNPFLSLRFHTLLFQRVCDCALRQNENFLREQDSVVIHLSYLYFMSSPHFPACTHKHWLFQAYSLGSLIQGSLALCSLAALPSVQTQFPPLVTVSSSTLLCQLCLSWLMRASNRSQEEPVEAGKFEIIQ